MENKSKKIWALVGVAVIVAAGYFIYQANRETVKKEVAGTKEEKKINSKEETSKVNLPSATGKTEDIINSLNVGIASEEKADVEEDAQVKATLDDSAEVSAFGQTYDEKEF